MHKGDPYIEQRALTRGLNMTLWPALDPPGPEYMKYIEKQKVVTSSSSIP